MALESERPKYPGMFLPEQEVWRAWLTKHQQYYESFEYNVRVGPGEDPGPTYDKAMREGWIKNTQSRIDVVGYKRIGREIIEVKVRAASDVIGQIQTYLHLYPSSYEYAGPLTARIVCNECPAFFYTLTRNLSIDLDVLGISVTAPTGSF